MRQLKRLYRWLIHAEEARAIYTWLVPLIPAGIGGVLAAFAQANGYLIWLVGLMSYALFAASRFFVTDYVTQFGLRGQITALFHQLISAETTADGKHMCGIQFQLVNGSDRPIFARTKTRVLIGGLVAEEHDFDAIRPISKKSDVNLITERVKLDDSWEGTDWSADIEVKYGYSPKRLNMVYHVKVKRAGSTTYSTILSEYNPVD